jgi:hypothetical protein
VKFFLTKKYENLEPPRHTIVIVIRLSSILKLDQQFIYFNAQEIFYAFEVECEMEKWIEKRKLRGKEKTKSKETNWNVNKFMR